MVVFCAKPHKNSWSGQQLSVLHLINDSGETQQYAPNIYDKGAYFAKPLNIVSAMKCVLSVIYILWRIKKKINKFFYECCALYLKEELRSYLTTEQWYRFLILTCMRLHVSKVNSIFKIRNLKLARIFILKHMAL